MMDIAVTMVDYRITQYFAEAISVVAAVLMQLNNRRLTAGQGTGNAAASSRLRFAGNGGRFLRYEKAPPTGERCLRYSWILTTPD